MYQEIKQEILDKIKEHNTIIIVRHIRPDGDCLGASIGLREILRSSFPNKKIYSVGESKSPYLDFLGLEDELADNEIYKDALIIVVDTATFDRVDNANVKKNAEIIKIDHHIRVEDYGKINYVREDLPATCAIITDFYDSFKDELILSNEAALALYTGMVTDTGRFKYRGVNSDVLRLASILLTKDLDIEDIYARLYLRDKESLKLQGYVLNKFKTTENGVAYFEMTKSVQKRFNVSVEDASSLISTLDGIRGHMIWVFFIEHEDGFKRVRIRSRFVSINEIAQKFNGGGHKQASGATVKNARETKLMLQQLDKLLASYKLENKEKF